MSHDPAPSNVLGPRRLRFLLVLETLLFLLTQGIAVLVFIRTRHLPLESQILLYVVTFSIPLPWLTAIQGYRRIKRRLVKAGADQVLLSSFSFFSMHMIGASYLPLMSSLLILLSALHSKGP